MKNTPEHQALKRAIAHCGSARQLAEAIGVTRSAVSLWHEVPPLRVLAVEAATGGAVTRHELRPDLYPEEAKNLSG